MEIWFQLEAWPSTINIHKELNNIIALGFRRVRSGYVNDNESADALYILMDDLDITKLSEHYDVMLSNGLLWLDVKGQKFRQR